MPRRKSEPDAPSVHVRRMYVDCRYGQMHVRTAFSGGGGFDELTSLVCLHQSPMSGRVFDRFLPLMGTDRTVYAPDTPGFGDSARLQRRLAASGQPVGWFLSQVWDRFADRAFWCSQQAMRTARESADVVLYVVNASEETAAGYIEPELRILDWLGKPALVLLNQVGTRTDAAEERALVARWEAVLRRHDPRGQRRVLSFDAFARCWLQEHTLLEAIAACLDGDARTAFDRLAQAWRERDLDTLRRSAGVIAGQLAVIAKDEMTVPPASLAARATSSVPNQSQLAPWVW